MRREEGSAPPPSRHPDNDVGFPAQVPFNNYMSLAITVR